MIERYQLEMAAHMMKKTREQFTAATGAKFQVKHTAHMDNEIAMEQALDASRKSNLSTVDVSDMRRQFYLSQSPRSHTATAAGSSSSGTASQHSRHGSSDRGPGRRHGSSSDATASRHSSSDRGPSRPFNSMCAEESDDDTDDLPSSQTTAQQQQTIESSKEENGATMSKNGVVVSLGAASAVL